mmetsp:Transcript_18171/g.20215  ORF Transcript_18171/g.20215 Transcript_18171/m.20215 type:complete len:99 (+) Transcript_18171:203-499(+)
MVWSFLPDSMLYSLGITYFPDKYWAVALPTWILVTLATFFFWYCCINLLNTEPLDSMKLVRDDKSVHISELTGPPGDIPPITDVPITEANRLMFLDNK